MITKFHPVAALVVCLALSLPTFAQEAGTAGQTGATAAGGASLQLELNALTGGETGCLVTFLATNELGAPLSALGYEFAFFDKSGAIDRLLLLDFKGLTAGKTKVSQFALDGLPCDNIGRVLINDVTACEGAGIAAGACLDQLVTSTKPDITFGT